MELMTGMLAHVAKQAEAATDRAARRSKPSRVEKKVLRWEAGGLPTAEMSRRLGRCERRVRQAIRQGKRRLAEMEVT